MCRQLLSALVVGERVRRTVPEGRVVNRQPDPTGGRYAQAGEQIVERAQATRRKASRVVESHKLAAHGL
jgi:hypothetical protein